MEQEVYKPVDERVLVQIESNRWIEVPISDWENVY